MKTLVKSKIVLIDKGTALMILLWRPSFKNFLPTIIGGWYPFGTCSTLGGIHKDQLDHVTDEKVSEVLYNEFIHKRNIHKINLLMWLKLRMTDITSEYNLLEYVNDNEKKVSTGGKLRGYKEIMDYVETHE